MTTLTILPAGITFDAPAGTTLLQAIKDAGAAIIGVSSKSRLACQTTLGEEPVSIELLSFV